MACPYPEGCNCGAINHNKMVDALAAAQKELAEAGAQLRAVTEKLANMEKQQCGSECAMLACRDSELAKTKAFVESKQQYCLDLELARSELQAKLDRAVRCIEVTYDDMSPDQWLHASYYDTAKRIVLEARKAKAITDGA